MHAWLSHANAELKVKISDEDAIKCITAVMRDNQTDIQLQDTVCRALAYL